MTTATEVKSLGQVAFEASDITSHLVSWNDLDDRQRKKWEDVALEVIGQQMARVMTAKQQERQRAAMRVFAGYAVAPGNEPPSTDFLLEEHHQRLARLEERLSKLKDAVLAEVS